MAPLQAPNAVAKTSKEMHAAAAQLVNLQVRPSFCW